MCQNYRCGGKDAERHAFRVSVFGFADLKGYASFGMLAGHGNDVVSVLRYRDPEGIRTAAVPLIYRLPADLSDDNGQLAGNADCADIDGVAFAQIKRLGYGAAERVHVQQKQAAVGQLFEIGHKAPPVGRAAGNLRVLK